MDIALETASYNISRSRSKPVFGACKRSWLIDFYQNGDMEDPPNSLKGEEVNNSDLGRRSPWWGWRKEERREGMLTTK